MSAVSSINPQFCHSYCEKLLEGKSYLPLVTESIGVAEIAVSLPFFGIGCCLKVLHWIEPPQPSLYLPNDFALTTATILFADGGCRILFVPIKVAQATYSLANRIIQQIT